jgi:chloramphenicol-sensitive protein RarD
MNNRKHYAAAISAFVIWGFFSLPLRALKEFGAGEILYFRILFSAVLLLIIVFGGRRKELRKDWDLLSSFTPRKKTNLILLTLGGGVLLTINWLVFIYTINAINIKTASFSYMICPVLTAVLGYLLLKEKITRIQWIAVGLCFFSCVLMGLNSVVELGYSFTTAVTYALYLVSQRKNQGFDRLTILGIQVLFSFLLLNIFYGYLINTVPVSGNFYLLIILIAAVFTVLPLFLNLFALNKIDSTTVGILLYINPLMNFGLAFAVFEERASTLQIVGYVVILIALMLFNYPNLKKFKAARQPAQYSA